MSEPVTGVIDDDTPSAAADAAIALRRPDIPVTLSELAALKGEAIEVIEARVQVLETLRKAAIRATSPEDWLLFKSPEEQGGQVVGYLQDAGAERVRDLYGIEIYDVSKPEKIVGNDPAVFHYLVTGSGRCKLTRQVLEQVEGGRSSTDDFCRGKTGAELELLVRKAARANLDGGITRELAGMKSVPLDELAAVWAGTSKKIENCRRGRGFGTRDERVGGRAANAPDIEPPVCPHCKSKGVYRPAKDDRKAFFGCPNYLKHQDKKFIVPVDEWVAEQAAKTAPAAQVPAEQPTGQASPVQATGGKSAGNKHQKVQPLHADDIFGPSGREREPGEEG
jgi:hypothetical protein